jgi:tetratricopeptide (TPR) repeat protein
MKKLILSLFLVISFTFSFAQKSNVSKAKNKALMENPDFSGAREAIKLALADSTTKNLANTLYIAGLIGYKENEAFITKIMLRSQFDTIAKGNAIMESYNYFITAIKLDSMPDAKGKVKLKVSKDIKPILKEYYSVQDNLFAYGAYLYEKKRDFNAAIKVWKMYLDIPLLPIINNEISTNDTAYMSIKYYSAKAAVLAQDHELAIKMLQGMKQYKYETEDVYQLLYEEYVKVKDTVNYVKTLYEGFDKYPSNALFLQNLISHLINTKKTAEALVYLNKAIEREPKIANYHYVKGNLDELLGNFDIALASFDKAIELDPTMADAWGCKGRLFFNKAVIMFNESNKIKDIKTSNAEIKKAEAVFKESIPYFKKASEINPKEIEYKKNLKTLYYRLKMDADYEAIKKEIDAM